MINKQRCSSEVPRKSTQINKNPSKKGNGVSTNGDKDNMEYRPVKKNPSWDGAGQQKDWA